MQNWNKRMNRFTTPCEEALRNNPGGGKRKTKKNEEEQGEPLTDVNYIPKISFHKNLSHMYYILSIDKE